MDDLISRQAAIDALDMEYRCTDQSDDWSGLKTAMLIIENLPSAQRWIPCSERLPEHSERYLVSALDGAVRRTTVAPFHPKSRTWSLTGRMTYWKVIAWMPLPEPYQAERREE